jgi:hypothetical protein
MNVLRYVFTALLLVTAAFGQSSKLREVSKLFSYEKFSSEDFSRGVTIFPKVYANSHKEDQHERINRDLERIFTPRKKYSFSVSEEQSDDPSFRHGLENSSVVEFAMMGAQDIKKLKGGFTIKNPFGGPDIDAYIKRGIAWHPPYDENLTYTVGKRITRSYKFNTSADIFDSHIKVPLVRFNARIEKIGERLLDKLGF